MIPAFIRKKFSGVQQPLGRFILRHILELIVLAPLILPTFLWFKFRKREVILVGVSSSVISSFLAPLEPEMRRRLKTKPELSRTTVLNLSADANSQIRKMYDQIVTIYGDEQKIRRKIVWWVSKLGVQCLSPNQNLSDISWRIDNPSIDFFPIENVFGHAFLESHGIKRGESFVCFATRSESYYRKLIESGVVVKPRSVRNPNEGIYLDVAKNLSKLGLTPIRMGKDLDTKISAENFPEILDYATSLRTDFLDCFLLKNCKFLFVGNTGIVWFRWLFNLPNLHCDVYDIRYTQFKNDIFVFQKVLFTKENRIATVSEMLKMRSEYSDERHQERLGVELVKNTADEIFAACEEMNARIDGTWETTPEDELLQQRYLDLVIKYSDQPTWQGGGRVGTQFLRDNQDLLR